MKKLYVGLTLILLSCLGVNLARGQNSLSKEEIITRAKPATVLIETDRGWGSGFFVSCDGYLITNQHVIEDAQRITVIYRNRERLSAKVVASDSEVDLALLKVVGEQNYPTLTLGDSDSVQEGLEVAVTGYPLPDVLVSMLGSSLQSCTSQGIVSAFRANAVPGVSRSRPLLQFDAGATNGNSGGPVYRLDTGEVVGIVCLGITKAEFLNLGVPSNEAKLLLLKAGVTPQSNPVDLSSPLAAVSPGDISLLNIIGPDKALTSLLATSVPFQLIPQSGMDLTEQIYSNAGYLSCYGKLAPPVSEPSLVGRRLVFTGNDGRVRSYDPARVATAAPLKSLFNVDHNYMFFPAVGTEKQICFAAGTPTFSMREKVDTGMLLLSVLAGGYGGGATKIVPTINTRGSLFGINPNNGNMDWEYKCGFVGPPTRFEGHLYFGGMNIYGVLDSTTGRELWAERKKMGATHASWYNAVPGKKYVFLTVSPLEVKFSTAFPGFVVLGDSNLELLAVSPKDGKVVWHAKVTDLKGQETPLAVGLSVDDANQRIYVTRAGQAFAFSQEGKLLWSYGDSLKKENKNREEETKELVNLLTRFSTNICFDKNNLYLGGNDNKLYCINSATGELRWNFIGLAEMGDPALINKTLYCGSGDGWMYAIDPNNGLLKWKVFTQLPCIGRPLVQEDILYYSSQGFGGFAGQLNAVYLPKM
jgi:outer membrane protein assembly factor BamB